MHCWNAAANKFPRNRFHNSIRKHSPEAFDIIEIIPCASKEEMDRMERETIERYDSFNFSKGYNATLGGGGALGCKRSMECRTKMSASHKGKYCGPANPAYGMGGRFKGKVHSASTRKRMAESKSKYWRSRIRSSHCPQGHGFTPENTYIYPDGFKRACIACRKEAWLKWKGQKSGQHESAVHS